MLVNHHVISDGNNMLVNHHVISDGNDKINCQVQPSYNLVVLILKVKVNLKENKTIRLGGVVFHKSGPLTTKIATLMVNKLVIQKVFDLMVNKLVNQKLNLNLNHL